MIQYDDVMAWLTEAQHTLADVHKFHKYRYQDFLDCKRFKAELEPKREQVRASTSEDHLAF